MALFTIEQSWDQVETTLQPIERPRRKSLLSRCRSCSRFYWVLAMLLLGSADMLLQWINFADLSSEDLSSGILVGRLSHQTWVCLFLFTIVGTILYIPESANTLSVLCCDGFTKIPLVWEQILVITLEHLPLSATNYFVSVCRRHYVTTLQTLCATFSIIFVFVRLIWYAHIEGKSLKITNMKKGLFMLTCAIYACSMAFPILAWRSKFIPHPLVDDVKDVSIFLLNTPDMEDSYVKDYNLDHRIDNAHQYLVLQTIAPVLKAEPDSYPAYFYCNVTKKDYKPTECPKGLGSYLSFKFVYTHHTGIDPYGEIIYNFAKVTPNASDVDSCMPSNKTFAGEWKLFYWKSWEEDAHSVNRTFNMMISHPWPHACSTTWPTYDPTIPVCL